MESPIKARLQWVKLYERYQNAGYVCSRCGISRSTLRKWVRRYQAKGLEGLSNQSKRAHHSPNQKLNDENRGWVLALRKKRNLGVRRIKTELLRLHGCVLALATIQKVLSESGVKPLVKLKRKKRYKRYQRPIPGDRVQADTCKIAPGIYQYTAVDDCTRWRVLKIYLRANASHTLDFIDVMVEEFPFPIQRLQTDRGREFFAVRVQEKLMAYGIKFRPNKPASPHLNGKVERSQKTDLEEFYALANLADFDQLQEALAEWQFFYNWHRSHGSLKGKTPSEFTSLLSDKTPLTDEALQDYDPSAERIQDANYQHDLILKRLFDQRK
jgi:transposase InsO family protein